MHKYLFDLNLPKFLKEITHRPIRICLDWPIVNRICRKDGNKEKDAMNGMCVQLTCRCLIQAILGSSFQMMLIIAVFDFNIPLKLFR